MIKKNIFVFIFIYMFFIGNAIFAQNDEALQLYKIGSRQLYEASEKSSFPEIAEAVKILQHAYEKNDKFFNVIQDLARAYYLLGDFENAYTYVKRAMQLKKDNLQLQVLEANILIHQNKLDEAGSKILALLEEDSYDKGLLFTATLYFSAIGDFINYERTLATYKRLYQYSENEELLYMYTLLTAVDSGEFSPVTQKAARELAFSKNNNVWITWLLLEYFLAAPDDEISGSGIDVDEYVKKLQNSGVPLLREIAYSIILRTQERTPENIQDILDFAEDYTKSFPYSADAWFQRGLVLHSLKKYKEALTSFLRAKQAEPENSFFAFVVDNTLKKVRDQAYQHQVDIRVKELVKKGRNSLEEGNVTAAREYARRALYISPLAIDPRVLLSDIFTQQGFTLRASTELNLLLKQKNPPADIPAILESINAVTNNALEGFPRVSYETIPVIPWRISVNINTNESVKEEEKNFLQDLVTYSFSGYPKMRITNLIGDTEILLSTQKLSVEVVFAQNDVRFAARAILRAEDTNEIISIISESRSGNNREVDTVDALSQRINMMLPTVLTVLSEQESNSLLIGGGRTYSIEEGKTYPLYNTGNVRVTTDEPHFKSSNNQIGYLKINNVFSSYSIGVPSEKSSVSEDGEETDEPVFNKYGMLSEVNTGDIVIVKPEQWEDDRKNTEKIQFLTTRDSRATYVLKNMLLPLW